MKGIKSGLSIKLKITLWYTLALVIISAAVWGVMASVSDNILTRDAANRLTRTVDDMARGLSAVPPGQPDRMPPSRFFERGVHTALYGPGHELIDGFMPFDFAGDVEFRDGYLYSKTYDGTEYLIYTKKTMQEGSLWLMGIVSLTDETAVLSYTARTNFILVSALILAAAAGGYFMIRHAFKPVDRISKTAKSISESRDLSQRINLGSGSDEIYRLAATFDEMLDKIEKNVEKEKQFTADASHELRTPVAVIKSECEYVLDCVDSLDEAKESVEAIKTRADKMASLISDLLAISRLDRNMLNGEFEETDISELLTLVCDEQEEINSESGIALVRCIKPNVKAEVDRSLLTRLFINLISNAYQYNRENGRVAVTLEEDDGNIILDVSDSGVGIPEKDLPKIWERFYRADASRSSENGSMGLGLAMVKQIAAVHNGKITAKSVEGEGTSFRFVMPKTRMS